MIEPVTLVVAMKILLFCNSEINPNFIKHVCLEHVVECYEEGLGLETCFEFWE